MARDIQALPLWLSLIAYAVLATGAWAGIDFIVRYVLRLPWRQTEEGRHLVAMTAVVVAFFLLYLVLALWPTLPGRTEIRLGLLIVLVGTVVWRRKMLVRYLSRRATRLRDELTEGDHDRS